MALHRLKTWPAYYDAVLLLILVRGGLSVPAVPDGGAR